MEILELIEKVNPLDEWEMFSLNEKVYEWLLKINPEQKYALFVSSRDALKAIRPKDFVFYMETATDNWGASKLSGINNNINFESPILPTEELAELHAIIQAISYERENK